VTWVVVFIVVGIVLAIAAALVFREAARLHDDPPDAVFDPDDALGWVVEHLDDVVAATLTVKDVQRIIGFQMDYFRQRGVSHNGTRNDEDLPVVFLPEEAIDYIVEFTAGDELSNIMLLPYASWQSSILTPSTGCSI